MREKDHTPTHIPVSCVVNQKKTVMDEKSLLHIGNEMDRMWNVSQIVGTGDKLYILTDKLGPIVITENGIYPVTYTIWERVVKDQESTKRKVKVGWFGNRYLYLGDKTRVKYIYGVFGGEYKLQRKGLLFWGTVAETYAVSHDPQSDLENIVDILFKTEKVNQPPPYNPLF